MPGGTLEEGKEEGSGGGWGLEGGADPLYPPR